MTPEEEARKEIDKKLGEAGWEVQDLKTMDLTAGPGIAVREFPLKKGFGRADYMLYADKKAVGVVEAKPVGSSLTSAEGQAARYVDGMPENLPAHCSPLLATYLSTGAKILYTNNHDPYPRSRDIFHFHRPQTLIDYAKDGPAQLRKRLKDLAPYESPGLWSAQRDAIQNLQKSLAHGRQRALIQMATGSGKTFTAANLIYLLLRHAGARRILFLVDRTQLGRQAHGEITRFVPPDDNRRFGDLHVVQHMRSNKLDPASEVVITTIQRMYSMLQGDEEYEAENEDGSLFDTAEPLVKEPVSVAYNAELPIETFDFVIIDECHRSIYKLWSQVTEYFDAFLVGLTATPSKQTVGFFGKNLVMEYGHAQAVADGVNVDFDVYRIDTQITQAGSTVAAKHMIDKRDRLTRKVRHELLDDDLTYTANQLDRDVVAVDQIRTVIRTFRDKLFTELFPGRAEVPKTLIFAKDDMHADDIVDIVRDEFGKGNDFCQKITYRTGHIRLKNKVVGEDGAVHEEVVYKKVSNLTPEEVLNQFRTHYEPRVVVTVDLVATGTDVKPLEIVMFMRNVKSALYFDQMKGRGVRVISPNDLRAVSGDAELKDHFVIVDCVGVCERDKTETVSLDRHPSVPIEKILSHVAMGGTDPDALSSLASKLVRLEKKLTDEDKAELVELSGGHDLPAIAAGLVKAIDPDEQERLAREEAALPEDAEVPPDLLSAAAKKLADQAVAPFLKASYRKRLLEIKAQTEQVIDRVSADSVIFAGFDAAAEQKARQRVEGFQKWIDENRKEIQALQFLYSGRYGNRVKFEDIKDLASRIQRPPVQATPEQLWDAFKALEKSRVHAGGGKQLVDLVSLIRHVVAPEEELIPFNEIVMLRYSAWLGEQLEAGAAFTTEQRQWLDRIAEHIASSLAIERDDFGLGWFAQHGDLGKAYELFGERLDPLLAEMNEALVA